MLKSYGVILAFAASSLIGVSAPVARVSPGKTGPDCAAVFRANQTTIETLAGQGSTTDIQAIFVRAGCPAPSVGLPSAQKRAPSAASVKIKCRFKLLPPSLICTF